MANDREWIALTDEDRDRAFQTLPDMLDGFMKKWGWLHFAKAIEDICREKNLALTAPVATEQAQAVGACVFLDFKQATDVLAMFGGEPGEVQLQFGDGHGGRGLYASYAEYPEEGAEYLGMSDGEALPSPEAAPAAMEGDPAEAAEILKSLIDNIERGGMYSQESTLGFLSQAYYCLKPANPAATPAAPSIGTASMYAQQHGLAVTTEWMIGWNACLDAIDAAALAQPAQEATLPAWWERFMHELTLQAEDEVRADLPGVLETCALDAIAALAAPVQQDAPAPSMVGDAKGGA